MLIYCIKTVYIILVSIAYIGTFIKIKILILKITAQIAGGNALQVDSLPAEPSGKPKRQRSYLQLDFVTRDKASRTQARGKASGTQIL